MASAEAQRRGGAGAEFSVSEARGERQEVSGGQLERRAAARMLRAGCSPWRHDKAGCASEKASSALSRREDWSWRQGNQWLLFPREK